MSDWALWRNDGPTVEGELVVQGQLVAKDASSATVRELDRDVRCAHSNGNFAAFAIGQAVEMHCHLRQGTFRIGYVKNEHTKVVLEP
ncbi:MAG: hypothetical protein H0U90_07825 [Actinobacteria bacterium]|nr:hypothetical protein [Actinomycetota bacterium]